MELFAIANSNGKKMFTSEIEQATEIIPVFLSYKDAKRIATRWCDTGYQYTVIAVEVKRSKKVAGGRRDEETKESRANNPNVAGTVRASASTRPGPEQMDKRRPGSGQIHKRR
jgi:hypothetical protein